MAPRSDSFGTRLRALRRQANLSQVELAREVGRHQTAIGPYERDEYSPAREVVDKFARVLETTPEFLLFGREPNQASFAVQGTIGPGGMMVDSEISNSKQWIELKNAQLAVLRIDDDTLTSDFPKGSFFLILRDSDTNVDAWLGRNCLVETNDGRRLLRRIMPDREAGRYMLVGNENEIIHNVEVVAVQPVLGMLQPGAIAPIGRSSN